MGVSVGVVLLRSLKTLPKMSCRVKLFSIAVLDGKYSENAGKKRMEQKTRMDGAPDIKGALPGKCFTAISSFASDPSGPVVS